MSFNKVLELVLSWSLIVGSVCSCLGLLWIFDKTLFVLILCLVVGYAVRFTYVQYCVVPVRETEAEIRQLHVQELQQRRYEIAQLFNGALDMERRQNRLRRDEIVLRLEEVKQAKQEAVRTRESAHQDPPPPPGLTAVEKQRETRRLRAAEREAKKEEQEREKELRKALSSLDKEARELQARERELYREDEAVRLELYDILYARPQE